jgi:hypothetical protein
MNSMALSALGNRRGGSRDAAGVASEHVGRPCAAGRRREQVDGAVGAAAVGALRGVRVVAGLEAQDSHGDGDRGAGQARVDRLGAVTAVGGGNFQSLPLLSGG